MTCGDDSRECVRSIRIAVLCSELESKKRRCLGQDRLTLLLSRLFLLDPSVFGQRRGVILEN